MRSQTQRSFLFAFIASISLCGAIGIYCLLIGEFTSLVAKVLGTTATVAGASLLALASAVPWERKRWQPIGPLGMLAAAVWLTLVLCLIWVDRLNGEEVFIKTTLVATVIAIALPHAGLIGLARLRRDYGWVRIGNVASIVALAGLIIVAVVFEIDDEFMLRVIGALAILDVCTSVAIPILHRVSAIHEHDSIRTTTLEVSLTCPRCSKTHSLPVGHSPCPSCGLRIKIEIEEEHCEQCGYVLFGTDSAVCPECGKPIRRETTTQVDQTTT